MSFLDADLQTENILDLFVPVFDYSAGEVSEWLKEHAWKVCIRETVSRVRIPLSPQTEQLPSESWVLFFMKQAQALRLRVAEEKRKAASNASGR
jgi:hypothetical protein